MNILDMQRELKERAGIFVSARDIERTLAALQTTTDIWTTVERSQVPMRVLCALLGILHEQNLIAIEDTQLILTDAGRAFCHEHQIAPWHATTCHTCNGRGVDIASLAGVVSAFREIARNRPEAIQDFDQGYVTEETTLARVAFLWWRGDLDGKEIIVLGDDDLVSIACALTGKPKRVVALDIDDRLISFIDAVSNERELTNLTTLQHDLREPLPDELVGKFDVFFTDPTESFVGFQAFVERGLLCLKGAGGAGYFGLTHVESSLRKWREIQRFLLDAGAVITDLIDGFNHYVNWGYIDTMRSWNWLPVKVIPKEVWYKSALYRIEWLEPQAIPNRRFEGNIFEDEEAATT